MASKQSDVDKAVAAIRRARTDAEARAIERRLIEQSDNRPQPSDPAQRVSQKK